MRSTGRGGIAVVVACICCVGAARADGPAGPTLAWSISLDGASSPNDAAAAIAVDARGDVLAAGQLGDRFAVVKRDGATGTAMWQQQVGAGKGAAAAVAPARRELDAGHSIPDVYAAGYLTNDGPSGDFTVVKLGGQNGKVLWTASFKGGAASGLAVDKQGDVIAVGSRGDGAPRFAAVKLSGTDGHVRWERQLGGDQAGTASAVAVDAAGDVVVVGYVRVVTNTTKYSVFKLAGATGQELWHKAFQGTDAWAMDVAIAPGGHVATAGTRDGHFTVMALALGSGQKQWEYTFGNQLSPPLAATHVMFTGAGDVLATGYTGPAKSPFLTTPRVALLKGSSGAAKWSLSFGAPASGAATALGEVAPLDHVVAVTNGDAVRVDGRAPADGSEEWTWDAPFKSAARAVTLHGADLFVGGIKRVTATSSDLLVLKLVIPAPCHKGSADCGVCDPPCGAHQVCMHGHCRVVEPAQPGGHMHKQ
jgi:hypothetical protein